jgi:secondary thiamine-phosphate synthase enzyme
MAVFRDKITLSTQGNRDMTDVTAEVAAVVLRSGIANGICNVFHQGSTGAVGTIEFEPGLAEDFPDVLYRLIPQGRNYGHERRWRDGNGHSHIQASLVGPSVSIPIEDGKLMTGNWQQIFHYEADIKPRTRTLIVTVVGE